MGRVWGLRTTTSFTGLVFYVVSTPLATPVRRVPIPKREDACHYPRAHHVIIPFVGEKTSVKSRDTLLETKNSEGGHNSLLTTSGQLLSETKKTRFHRRSQPRRHRRKVQCAVASIYNDSNSEEGRAMSPPLFFIATETRWKLHDRDGVREVRALCG